MYDCVALLWKESILNILKEQIMNNSRGDTIIEIGPSNVCILCSTKRHLNVISYAGKDKFTSGWPFCE